MLINDPKQGPDAGNRHFAQGPKVNHQSNFSNSNRNRHNANTRGNEHGGGARFNQPNSNSGYKQANQNQKNFRAPHANHTNRQKHQNLGKQKQRQGQSLPNQASHLQDLSPLLTLLSLLFAPLLQTQTHQLIARRISRLEVIFLEMKAHFVLLTR